MAEVFQEMGCRLNLSLLSLWIAAAVGWPADARAQSPRLLRNDLGFIFVCKQDVQSVLEDGIERFLKQRGFKVLNQARIMRERGVFIFDILIMGLDERRRIFKFSALPRTKGRYAASLITPPPTQRSTDLEEAVLKLVSEQLGCEVSQVARGENPASTEDYDKHYKIIEDLFQKAERLQGQGRL